MRLALTSAVVLFSPFVLTSWSCAQAPIPPSDCGPAPVHAAANAGAGQSIDLAALLANGALRGVNRDVRALPGRTNGVHVTEHGGPGVIWIGGSDFAKGTIDVDVCGRDVTQRSFVGVAFHRRTDDAYEGVYLRPFNFRASGASHHHAAQYIAVPEYDWPRLRQEFPEQFEGSIDQSVTPTGWVPLTVVVTAQTIRVYAGGATSPVLDVRTLGHDTDGQIGLWVGNNSDGNFANLRLTPAR